MLNELIFLGLIPGTNIQITITDIWDLVLISMVLVLCQRLFVVRHGIEHGFSFQNPRTGLFTQQAQGTGRRGSAPRVNNDPAQLDLFAWPIPRDA